MKKINIKKCLGAEKIGVQDLYETIEECKLTSRSICGCKSLLSTSWVIGMVFGNGNEFIQVIEGMDEYELLKQEDSE